MSIRIGISIPGQAVAMASGINIPAIFHERFRGVEEVCVELNGNRGIDVKAAGPMDRSGVMGERVRLDFKGKQRKKKIMPQIRIPLSERIWNRLNFYQHNAGQPVELTFKDEGDYLSVTFD